MLPLDYAHRCQVQLEFAIKSILLVVTYRLSDVLSLRYMYHMCYWVDLYIHTKNVFDLSKYLHAILFLELLL